MSSRDRTRAGWPRYISRMDERKRLEQELAEAEAAFDAATKLGDIKRTAGRLHRARAALKDLDKAERSKWPGRGSGGASS
jgi:hypothetical protein